MHAEETTTQKTEAIVNKKTDYPTRMYHVSHDEDHSYQGVLINRRVTTLDLRCTLKSTLDINTLDIILEFDVSRWGDVADKKLLEEYRDICTKFNEVCDRVHVDNVIEITYSTEERSKHMKDALGNDPQVSSGEVPLFYYPFGYDKYTSEYTRRGKRHYAEVVDIKIVDPLERSGDGSHEQYQTRCETFLKRRGSTGLSRKYAIEYIDRMTARILPQRYTELSVIAEPYPIQEEAVRNYLIATQNAAMKMIPGFVPVTAKSFHMTIAGIVAGAEWEEEKGRQQVQRVVEECLKTWKANSRLLADSPLRGQVLGIGFLPGCVVAVVGFKNEEDYRRIVVLRELVYDECTSREIEWTRYPFLGHITLGYLLVEQTETDSIVWSVEKPTDTDFIIESAGLYFFENVLSYNYVGPRFSFVKERGSDADT